jgi:hypothetical protein
MSDSALTPAQLEFFEEHGYLMVPDVIPPADLEPLRQEIAGLVDGFAKDLHTAGQLDRLFEDEPFETRLARIAEHDPEAGEAIVRRLKGKGGGGHAGPAMFETIRHPSLLAHIEDFVGPEIVGSSVYRIRPKLPKRTEGEVPWHQDSGYLLDHCDRQRIITCWVPLVEATVENGCLSVRDGGHRHGVAEHYRGGNAGFLVINDTDLPPGRTVPVPVPLGGVLFMTNLTPHCSTPNSSDHVRWSIDLRYQGADVPTNAGVPPEQQFEGRAPIEVACYPPEADFVIQSCAHPEQEVRDLETFVRLRERYEKYQHGYAQLGRWKELASTNGDA